MQERRLFAGCRLALSAVALFSFAINILMLTGAFYMFQVFDRVLVSRSLETLIWLTVIALAALATLGLLDSVRARVMARLGGWIEHRLSLPVLAKSVEFANAGRSGGTQRLVDLAQLRAFLGGPGILALFDMPWVLVYLLAIWLLHPSLGQFAAIGAVILLALALLNERLTHGALKTARALGAEAERSADAMIRNAGAIDALGLMSNLAGRWSRSFAESRRPQLAALERGGTLLAAAKFSRAALQILIMGLGAFLVIEHQITAGAMIAASVLLGRALAPIEQANAHLRHAISAWDAARRLNAFLAGPDRREPMPLPPPRGHLALEQVCLALPQPRGQPRRVLSQVSFEASPGEIVAVIGPSAAGKSTLARLLVGIQAPSAGTVRLDGAEVSAWSRAELGPHIGYLPQELQLFAGTVKDNIGRMGEADPSAVVEAARRAGCHEMILKLPQGYDTEIGEGGLHLSGGQRQRIALARAFYGDPRVLVLDEPDASLDGEGEAALLRALARAKEERCTTIVIAHRASILAQADRIVVLHEGKVELIGPRAEVAAALAKRSAAMRQLRPVSTAPRLAGGVAEAPGAAQ